MTALDVKVYATGDHHRLFDALRITGRGNRYWCPFCQRGGSAEHSSPDFSVYHNGAMKCFKCGGGWDVYKLVMDLHQCDFQTARAYIMGVYGLSDGLVLPERVKARTIPKVAKPKRTYPTFEDAVAGVREGMIATMGDKWTNPIVVGEWQYMDALKTTQVRFANDDRTEKSYRPFYKSECGWVSGAPPKPWPLYRVLDVVPYRAVFVVEGEKTAEALRGLGLQATTSLSGAGAADKANWGPIEAYEMVYIWPDNDKAGRKYAEEVKKHVKRAKIMDVRGLPEGGDAFDWVDMHGWMSDKQKKDAIIEMAKGADTCQR